MLQVCPCVPLPVTSNHVLLPLLSVHQCQVRRSTAVFQSIDMAGSVCSVWLKKFAYTGKHRAHGVSSYPLPVAG
jgi:hypothetical protein